MKIIKKHAIYNNLNLANLARKCKLKIKVKENKEDEDNSELNEETLDSVEEEPKANNLLKARGEQTKSHILRHTTSIEHSTSFESALLQPLMNNDLKLTEEDSLSDQERNNQQ